MGRKEPCCFESGKVIPCYFALILYISKLFVNINMVVWFWILYSTVLVYKEIWKWMCLLNFGKTLLLIQGNMVVIPPSWFVILLYLFVHVLLLNDHHLQVESKEQQGIFREVSSDLTSVVWGPPQGFIILRDLLD